MVEFKESKFYKLLQDFFINNNKETFLQMLAEFYNRTEGIIDKNKIQDDLIKDLRELYLEFNEKGIDENIVREKVNQFVENNEIIKDVKAKLIINTNKIEDNTEKLNINTSNIENISSKLDTNTKTRIAKDINSSDYLANTQIDVEYYKMKQTQLFSKFIRKLIKGENVTGIFQGDSLTYGADKYSNDKRPPDSTPAPDGSVNTSERASITYPEAVQEFLSSMFSGNITIINRGYAGIYAERSMRMWNEKVTADFNVIMLGTNDSRNKGCPYVGNIETYIYWVEQIILQNLIWDIPVILLTPPKTKLADDLDIDTFGNGLINLAKKYNIPVLDTREVFKGYPSTIYSDVTHFNGKGYSVLGARLAAFMLGYTKNKIVNVNDVLLTRPQVDNCYYKGNAKLSNISAPFTPEEYAEGQGIYAKIHGGKLTYSFYANSDNMVIIPIVNVYPNCTFKMSLDFGTEPSQLSLVQTVFGNSTTNKKYNNIYTYTNNTESNKQTTKKEYITNKEIPLLITQKGWHTITIECENCNFFGLEFSQLDYFIEEEKPKGYYLGYTHNEYTSHNQDVTETRIKLDELKSNLGNLFYDNMSYYRTPVLEITVTNYYKNVIKYWVMCGRTTQANEWVFLGEQAKAGRSNVNERTITNVTFDSNSKELVIAWGGATTHESNFVISIH